MNKLSTDKLNKRTKDKRVPYATIKQFIQQLTFHSTPSSLGGGGGELSSTKRSPLSIPIKSTQRGPGSNPYVDAICGLRFLLVLSFAPRGFSPGTPVFPSP